MDQRQKTTQIIGQKHRMPSEKEKKERQKCSNVYTFFTSMLKEITALTLSQTTLKRGSVMTQLLKKVTVNTVNTVTGKCSCVLDP